MLIIAACVTMFVQSFIEIGLPVKGEKILTNR